MLRLLITASIFTLSTLTAAQATNIGCNPAIQNWVNGSKMSCPFDSNTAAIQRLEQVEIAPPPPPPPPPEKD